MSMRELSANNCFVCGPENPIGLKIDFYIDQDDICRAEFTPGESHGVSDTTHGGIIFSLLDDVMANWLFLKDKPAQTAKCDLRYKNSCIQEKQFAEGHHLKTNQEWP